MSSVSSFLLSNTSVSNIALYVSDSYADVLLRIYSLTE